MAQNVDRPIVGVLWMVLTGLLFVAVTAIVKHLGDALPPAESAFLRYLLGLVFLVPVLGAMRRSGMTRRDVVWFSCRGTVHAFGVMLWFYAMTKISLAEVTAMNYLSPVYVTLGAALFLGEKLAFRRVMAIVVALIGALLIIRPGFREVSSGHFAMMVTAVLFGASYLIAKHMSGRVGPATVVGMLSIVVTLVLAPFAAAVWVTPTGTQLAWISLLACFATAGHFTMTLAFRAAPVTVTQPATFLQLVWAMMLGALVFGEPLDIWVVLGGTLIMSAITFISWREAMLNRKSVAPPHIATKV